jgi:hypothetical protein
MANTAIVSWQDKLAALAKKGVEQEAHAGGGGTFIGTRAGQLTYQGNAVAGNKLDVIVADSIMENAYYVGRFDPENPAPPVCFSFGRDEKTMVPHPDAAAPQHTSCVGCPKNEFGSAESGAGKACKNIRRLALIPAKPLDEDAVRTAEVAYLKLPVTSVKNWATYVKTLDALSHLPPVAVVTQISTQPDAKSQFKITFNNQATLPEDIVTPILERLEMIEKDIEFPYSPSTQEAKPAGKGKKY